MRLALTSGLPSRARRARRLSLVFAVGLALAAISSAQAQGPSEGTSPSASYAKEGDSQVALGHYADAEPLYKRALEVSESRLGPDNPGTAAILNKLARLYFRQGRYAEAEPLYKRAQDIWERALGADHPAVAVALGNLAILYEAQGRYADAEPLLKRALEIDRKAGPDRPEIASDLSNLAMLYDQQGRYAEAEPLMKQALAIDRKAFAPDRPEVAADLNNLGLLYDDQGRYADAEPLLKQAGAIDRKALGPDHPELAANLNNLALVYQDQGRYAEAQPLYKQALAIREKALGDANPNVAMSQSNLAGLYWQQGRYAEAEQLEQRALEIREKTFGPDNPSVATSLDNLAVLHVDQGRYADAEQFEARALAIREKALGSDNLAVAKSLSEQAHLYENQGRYAQAEPLYKRALKIREKLLGPDHPMVAASLNDLAVLYRYEGRYVEAEPLHKRALAIDQRALGANHPEIATDLNNLALLYADQGHYDEAEPLYKRALQIREQSLGPDHPEVAASLSNLAGLYMQQEHYADAEPLYKRALAIDEQVFGPDHPEVATSLRNLAALYRDENRYNEAAPLLERAVAIRQKIFGRDHPDVAEALAQLAETKQAQGDLRGARELFERARQTMLAVRRVNAGLGEAGLRSLLKPLNAELVRYLALLAAIARDPQLDNGQTRASADAFVVAEQIRGGPEQAAMAQSGARAASGDPAIAALVRRVQDLSSQYAAVGEQIDLQYSQPAKQQDPALIESLQKSYGELNQSLAAATGELYRKFPRYAELVAPDPITADETQRLLRPGEALAGYYLIGDRLLAWLVRPDRALAYRDTPIDSSALSAMVSRLRASIVPPCDIASPHCQIPPFDAADAYGFYALLLKPLESELAGTRHLIVVPDNALLPVPFAALITSANGDAYETLAGNYKKGLAPSPRELGEVYPAVPWLLNAEFAINELPSATALRMLRTGTPPAVVTASAEPFLGIGDPTLQGGADCGEQRGDDERGGAGRGGEMINACAANAVAQLCPLPGAGPELVTDAQALGAYRASNLFTGLNATRSSVMGLNASGRLGNARVIAFATHALTGGHMETCTEPALVLTPARNQSDSGLLGVEDILGFKLVEVQWVILSACNTGAAGENGEGLSGLVRAFFYAGAPSLLVSQWAVDDAATQQLMSSVLRYYASHPQASRADALREGMRELLTQDAKGNQAYFAHPFAWASFFIAGEGGAGQ